MKNEKTLVKNSIYYSASTLICMVIPLIIYPYITRTLGPENYGKFSFALNLVTYFSLMAVLGIAQHSQRVCTVANEPKELAGIIKTILTISATLTGVSLLIYIVVVSLLDVDKTEIWMYVFLAGMILVSSLSMDWLIIAKENFAFVSARNAITRLLLPVLAFFFVRDKADYPVYALVYVLCYSVLAALMNYVYIGRKRLINFSLIKQEKIDFVTHLSPIFFLSLVTIGSKIFSGMDVMMLRFLKDDMAVGIYSNAIKLPLVMDELLMAIAAVITPKLYQAVKREDVLETKSLINYASNSMLFFAVPAILTCVFFPKELIFLIAGKEYLNGSSILVIYSLIMLTTLCLTLGGTRMFIARGKEKQLFAFLLISGAINATLNYFLIPILGGFGAALATIIANICMFIIEATYIKSWGLIFNKEKFKYLVSGGALCGVFVVIKNCINMDNTLYVLLFAIAIGGIAYVAASLIVKETTAMRILNSLVGFAKKFKSRLVK